MTNDAQSAELRDRRSIVPEDAAPAALPPLWRLVTLFVFVQAAIILTAANGPFIDEGIMAAAGMRVLEGRVHDDHYLGWFQGSPYLWPILAGLGFRFAGLVGARLVALAFTTVALIAFARATRELFGKTVAWWATASFAVNGLFLALAHFAVYDVFALALLSIAFASCARYHTSTRPAWLITGAVTFGGAVVAKYGSLLSIVPLLGLVIARPCAPRWDCRAVRCCAFVGTALLVSLPYFLDGLTTWLPGALSLYAAHQRIFGRPALAWILGYFIIVPAILGTIGGIVAWRRGHRWLSLVLVGTLFIAPSFHLWTTNHVSAQKHVVPGFLFIYPLVGVALEALWASGRLRATRVVLLALALWGGCQWYRQEWSWVDTREAAEYLLTHLKKGEQVGSHQAWIYIMYLYRAGLITGPGDVFDRYAIEHRRPDLCRMRWLVGEVNLATDAGDEIVQTARRCGHLRVRVARSRTSYIGGAFEFGTAPVAVLVYRTP